MPITPRQRVKAIASRKKTALARTGKVVKFTTDREMWERLPNEPSDAYLGFAMYRDLDPADRTYARVDLLQSRQIGSCSPWGRTFRWVERAAAWDFHLERARLATTEKYQVEMAARHADIAKSMLDKVRSRLEKINFNALDPKAISQWLEIGVKVERLARGLSSDGAIQKSGDINIDLRQMSEAQIIAEIAAESKRSGRQRVLDIASVEVPPNAHTT